MKADKIPVKYAESIIPRTHIPAFMMCDINDVHPNRVGVCAYDDMRNSAKDISYVKKCQYFMENIEYDYNTGDIKSGNSIIECTYMEIHGKCSLYVKPMELFKVANIRQFKEFVETSGEILWDEDQIW